ncbi:glycoside hydrolase family 3 protein [Butyrivibrio fibrisolvens]|uniref:glycoside hydrolase family 3 protein n=1 Tax=Pseudobutyrivibrio TaxID=46205 RepID=UPI0003FBE37D|nr:MULTISPECIES: glycoside hydrolase family 3 N-terminal domain-containing protein [Pseudobutyrivibrio]MDC7279697.1 glycoside hydrolase family 3 protein [Butyrivibrio fibrisolvens]SDH48930.1 beta-N-acetylhexosaminidase [Pseudobutyrivibrio sp. 49]SFN41283.1 beta-N-acetylhexosaminidase [Pseudobutyrivibrio sp. UC1225]
MSKIDFKGNPFYLDDEAVEWIESTFSEMSLEDKCGQVFCPMGFSSDDGVLNHIVGDIKVGGMMYRSGRAEEIQNTHRKIQSIAKVPLLLAANTEAGGDGLAFEGTSFGKPMAVAATADSEYGYKMGYVACKEGAALGMNWSFAPIVDINKEFHNPITNVRTFGDNPQMVVDFASRYMDGADENNVAVAIKHFPGDGIDERDQHILTSINSLSVEEWDETFGYVYKSLIDKGAKTVMVGHIACPAYVRKYDNGASREKQLLPASLSYELLTKLLRQQLGFNGLISTDATPMVGFTAAMKRELAIPTAIQNGCDMILFNKSLEEDYGFLMNGVKNGILKEERLDEAVLRILATKASLGLHKKQAEGTLVPGKDALAVVGCEEHRKMAKEVADKAITLVRDEESLLPLSAKKYKRIYLNVIDRNDDPNSDFVKMWKEKLEEEGFEVKVRDRRTRISVMDFADPSRMTPEKQALMNEMYRSVADMKADYDLYLYVCNMENASNNTTLRLNWNVLFGLGDDAPWHASEIPMLMVSTAYPYHLFDAPMMKTYINTYSGNEEFVTACIDKLMGRSSFKGISPVDPLCGKDYI